MTAICATSWVTEERGRWVVSLDVLFPDTTVTHRITDFHTAALAHRAADWIERAANRTRT